MKKENFRSFEGLTSQEAARRLKHYGYNLLEAKGFSSDIKLLLEQFYNPALLLLLVAGFLSFGLGDNADGLIISVIVIFSVLLTFLQERSAIRSVEDLVAQTSIRSEVLRDGTWKEVRVEEVVPGDVVRLAAGDVVPADGVILEARDLFISEALLTGEVYPVEKIEGDEVFRGTHVVSGFAIMSVQKTGMQTKMGEIWSRIKVYKTSTEFENSLRQFGTTIMVLAFVLSFVIFATHMYFRRSFFESLTFSLAVSIGMSPVLLPAIVSVSLARGARRMAKKKVVVKKLSSLYNLGSMNILCCDKTGTLTENVLHLSDCKGSIGQEEPLVSYFLYLNSHFQTGYRNPIDDAVLKALRYDVVHIRKLDEIPYDFVRKRLSVLLEFPEWGNVMICKGAFYQVLRGCSKVYIGGREEDIEDYLTDIESYYLKLSQQGLRLIAVAYKKIEGDRIGREDEQNMVFLGFAIFEDPVKASAYDAVRRLREMGVGLKIITGDSKDVAVYVAKKFGLGDAVTGKELDLLTEDALMAVVEKHDVFAEVNPFHKERIVRALRKKGYVVGFLGDGINDIPAMREADVSISVNNAVDIAKDSADILLMEEDLSVMADGIEEGRKVLQNTFKYLRIQSSSNFGNMFSMTGASLLIPFIPMLPQQVLFNNLLSDLALSTLPFDRVPDENVRRPVRLRVDDIVKFMVVYGPLSSVFDYITFFFLLGYLHTTETVFRTGWFLESGITQMMVVLVLRSRLDPWKDVPAKPLLVSTLGISLLYLPLLYTPVGYLLDLVPLPLKILVGILLINVTYLICANITKRFVY